MPQLDFSPENRRETNSRAENLLKLKVGESARVVMLERPTFAWVHNLRAPKIVNGQAVKVMKKRKGSEEEYADFDYDFIGRPLCLGDYGVIKDKGTDEKHCPACQAAVEGGEVAKPERRFAVNLIRYNTKADGSLINPFGCSCVIWAFTEGVWDKLFDIAQEHGDLIGRDLLLGPCEPPEHFQRLKAINVGARDVWKLDQVKGIVVETFKNNRDPDLENRAIGRPVERRWMERDILNVAERWRIANGTPSPTDGTEGLGASTLTAGLDGLLNEAASASNSITVTQQQGAAPAVEPGSIDLGDLLGGANPAAEAAPGNGASAGSLDFSDLVGEQATTPANGSSTGAANGAAAPTTTATAVEPAVDFDELLKSLG